jgi:germination protein M
VVQAHQLPPPTPPPEQQVLLLFLGPDGRLQPELRTVPLPEEVGARARVVVQELLAGSIGGLGPVVPYQADVNAVFVDERGNAFIDLTAPPEPLDGSHIELTLAYGVVDSVLLNCPELRAVQILFGGREVTTLTGHLDLSRPLVLNKRFIAQS